MTYRRAFAALVLSAAAAAPALANETPLAADGNWAAFSVDSFAGPSFGLGWIDEANGSPLGFAFNIAAGFVGTLTVVDAAFAGDTFSVTDLGSLLGSTSAVPIGDYDSAADVGFDYAAALADARFSRGVFSVGAGEHLIGGSLLQSVLLGGERLDATAGAVRLTVAPIPEPSTYALLMAGLGVVGFLSRRRAR